MTTIISDASSEAAKIIARLARGYARMWTWIRAKIAGARGYRYDGEQQAHAEQLRETEVSLALMASVTDDPDQVRMASEIEHGAEERLGVLLGKARLTLEEKRERDAIQAVLAARRQSMGEPVLVRNEQARRPMAFLGPLAAVGGVRLWMVLAAGWALTGGFLALQMGLKERIEDQRDEARADLAMAERTIRDTREIANRMAEEVRRADELSRQTAANLEAERARNRAAAERERRRQRELRQVDSGGPPPDWERSLRGDAEPASGADADRGGGPAGRAS